MLGDNMENKTLITPEWLKRNGWVKVDPDTWTKVINGVWYNIIRTDMDNTYILTKSVGMVNCTENLIELIE